HRQTLVAARVDAVEGLQVHVHVEGQAVEAAAAAHAQAQRGHLGVGDIHARRTLPAFGDDVPVRQRIDDRLLDLVDQLAHAQPGAAQVDQRVTHDLAGAVVG